MKIDYEDELLSVIKALGDNGILANIIVIGSWATYFYVKIFDGFIPSIRTIDLDFYIPQTKNIHVKKSVAEALKPLNFDQIFDYMTEKSKFISPDGFEIEFLAKLRKNQNQIVKVDSLGVNAEQLGNLDIFNKGYIEVDFEGYTVKVTSPSAYIVQKILISNKRSEDKYNKDLESIKIVYEEVKKSKNHMTDLMSVIASLGKRTKSRYNRYVGDNNLDFPISK